LPVFRVVLTGQRPEDEDNVIIPNDWDPFRTGRSLVPNGDLCEPWSFFSTHQQVEEQDG